MGPLLGLQSVLSALHPYTCSSHVPYMKESLFSKQRAGVRVCINKMLTYRAHQLQKFNESLSCLPLTLPRIQCVQESRNLVRPYAMGQPSTSFPHPAATLKVTLHKHIFFVHLRLSWILVRGELGWETVYRSCSK